VRLLLLDIGLCFCGFYLSQFLFSSLFFSFFERRVTSLMSKRPLISTHSASWDLAMASFSTSPSLRFITLPSLTPLSFRDFSCCYLREDCLLVSFISSFFPQLFVRYVHLWFREQTAPPFLVHIRMLVSVWFQKRFRRRRVRSPASSPVFLWSLFFQLCFLEAQNSGSVSGLCKSPSVTKESTFLSFPPFFSQVFFDSAFPFSR